MNVAGTNILNARSSLCDNISQVESYDKICQVDGNNTSSLYDNISQIERVDNICQVDGNNSCASAEVSVESYDTDDEIDSEPVRAVLVPAQPQPGQPFSLEVGNSDREEAPSSLPLTMVANFRSAYNKVKNIKRNLTSLGLDFLVASESWERPRLPLEVLLDSPHYLTLSYCRGRDTPAVRTDGRHAGKLYPPKTGGGAAIFYNKHRFETIDTDIDVPAGIEAVWCVLSPRRMDSKEQRVKKICVASIYIAPRSPFKIETVQWTISYTLYT